ncbi:MAG: hypothetical protein H6725_05660 [Sandaracinaceae bacterium]|nr:hypothetical protein [Sandaracinaceae bacterium]
MTRGKPHPGLREHTLTRPAGVDGVHIFARGLEGQSFPIYRADAGCSMDTAPLCPPPPHFYDADYRIVARTDNAYSVLTLDDLLPDAVDTFEEAALAALRVGYRVVCAPSGASGVLVVTGGYTVVGRSLPCVMDSGLIGAVHHGQVNLPAAAPATLACEDFVDDYLCFELD